MKTFDAFGIEKALSEIYEACRQHDDFTSERSKLHPFELMSKSQTILFVDAEKNTIKQIHRRFCLGFESVKKKWICLLILHVAIQVFEDDHKNETVSKCSELSNKWLIYGCAQFMKSKGNIIFWENFSSGKIFLKIDDRFFTKIGIFKVAHLIIEKCFDFLSYFFSWLFLKKTWFLKWSDLCFLSLLKWMWFQNWIQYAFEETIVKVIRKKPVFFGTPLKFLAQKKFFCDP